MDTQLLKPYHTRHRPPRILIVAHEMFGGKPWVAERMEMLLDCLCLKYVAIGEDSQHVLVPAKYQDKTPLQCVQSACEKAASEGLPYDLIITDKTSLIDEIKAAGNPKLGLMVYTGGDPADSLRGKEYSAFCSDDADTAFFENKLTTFEELLEKELGKEGLSRLALCEGDKSALVAWQEVYPPPSLLSRPEAKPHSKEIDPDGEPVPRVQIGTISR